MAKGIIPKNLAVCVMALLLLALSSSTVFATKGPQGVTYGWHNLSVTAVVPNAPAFIQNPYKTSEDQICVFCHTPHSGSLDGPLWNRSGSQLSSWTHYNSASMSSYLKTLSVSRVVEDESLLCMSCHDGSVSVNHVLNYPNGVTDIRTIIGDDPDTTMLNFPPLISRSASNTDPVSSGIGDLSDDHPISFSYTGVLGSDEYTTGTKTGSLHTLAQAESNGVRFFDGGVTGDNRVECSSCHDPHVNYNANFGGDTSYTPFLITTNNGSALCLACHNK